MPELVLRDKQMGLIDLGYFCPHRELETKIMESLSEEAVLRAKKEAEESARAQLEVHHLLLIHLNSNLIIVQGGMFLSRR